MYDAHIRHDSWVEDVRTYADGEDPLLLLEHAADELGFRGGRVVLLDDRMWARFTQDFRDLFPTTEFGLASDVLEPSVCARTTRNLTHSGALGRQRTPPWRTSGTSARTPSG